MSSMQVLPDPVCFGGAADNLRDFAAARFGLFVHYGLYSILGRGEWALNREQIDLDEYRGLARRFDPVIFDANALARVAREAGCRYLCFTTMHHDGFALYDSKVNPFNSVNACGRDLVAEVVAACRQHGLRVHLYHSLNHWTASPDGVAALEDKADYEKYLEFTFARIEELVRRFNPIDCLWYDGWWPFHAAGWRSGEMNQMVRRIQPQIIFNGRNGLAGDFATPEQHMTAPSPWRPWEACFTHNGSWGFHRGDRRYKPDWLVLDLLVQAASGAGNLLLNIGPDGWGAVPQPSLDTLRELGRWLAINGEAVYGSEPFTLDWQTRGEHRGDWSSYGRYTARGMTLYIHLLKWMGGAIHLAGLEAGARTVRLLGSDVPLQLRQNGGRLCIDGLPAQPPHPLGGVVAVECERPPSLYLCGGMREPRVAHPRYDPCASDLPPH